jgi:hypothetical protein
MLRRVTIDVESWMNQFDSLNASWSAPRYTIVVRVSADWRGLGYFLPLDAHRIPT